MCSGSQEKNRSREEKKAPVGLVTSWKIAHSNVWIREEHATMEKSMQYALLSCLGIVFHFRVCLHNICLIFHPIPFSPSQCIFFVLPLFLSLSLFLCNFDSTDCYIHAWTTWRTHIESHICKSTMFVNSNLSLARYIDCVYTEGIRDAGSCQPVTGSSSYFSEPAAPPASNRRQTYSQRPAFEQFLQSKISSPCIERVMMWWYRICKQNRKEKCY